MEKYQPQYPTLPISTEPSAPSAPVSEHGQNFRISTIHRHKQQLETELNCRKKTIKKYGKALKVVSILDCISVILSISGTSASIGLALSAFGIPVAVGVQGLSIVAGGISLVAKYAHKKLQFKKDKHRNILMLTISKLSSIEGIVSKALDNGIVSSDEFQLVLSELKRYESLKDDLYQASAPTQIVDAETQEQWKELGRKEIELRYSSLLGLSSRK